MNKEAFLAVADAIEYSDRFDLSMYAYRPEDGHVGEVETLWDDCGTVGCVAGWTLAWAGVRSGTYWDTARTILDITDDQALRLFTDAPLHDPIWRDEYPTATSWEYTSKQAARLLRRIANGKVVL